MKAFTAGISISILSGLAKSSTTVNASNSTEECNYLDADSCRAAAESLGLQAGGSFSFSSTSGGYTPGCYFYPSGGFGGEAYFGERGTDEEKRADIVGSSAVRLDCNTNLTFPTVPDSCAIFDAETCRKAGEALGLGDMFGLVGADFSRSDENSGCYYYDPDVYLGTVGFALQGTVVYGTAGTKDEKKDPTTVPAYSRRLNCNTVLENGNSLPPDFVSSLTGEAAASSSSAIAALAPAAVIGLTLSLATIM